MLTDKRTREDVDVELHAKAFPDASRVTAAHVNTGILSVPDVFGDAITITRIENAKGQVARKGAVKIELPNGSTWVGSRIQFMELTRLMTELAVELTP